MTTARRWLRREDAEEAVQELACRLYKGHDTFDSSKGTFRDWVFGALKNVIIDIQRRKQYASLEYDPFEDGTADPERIAMYRELYDNALATLPENKRRALLMQMQDGVSIALIAKTFGVSYYTVAHWVSEARRKLRQYLERHDFE